MVCSFVVGLCAQGCTFDTSNSAFVFTDASAESADANQARDGSDQEVADAASVPICIIGSFNLCNAGPPAGSILVDTDQIFDTVNDVNCRDFPQQGGLEFCLLYVESFTVDANSTFRAFGNRPLLIASPGSILISGIVDVSSTFDGRRGPAANSGECNPGSDAQGNFGGGGGGSGGSFQGTGGVGGEGNANGALGSGAGGIPAPAIPAPTHIRGGCRGGNGGNSLTAGDGGDSGGAIAFASIAPFLLSTGASINASGAKGEGGSAALGGGGGGGSGGMIFIEAPAILSEGLLFANGGAGGGGANVLAKGSDGAHGTGATAAIGGNAPGGAGRGGNASGQNTSIDGSLGQGANTAAGGGGAAAGFILLRGTVEVPPIASPPAIQL